jgi:hypothetical protein
MRLADALSSRLDELYARNKSLSQQLLESEGNQQLQCEGKVLIIGSEGNVGNGIVAAFDEIGVECIKIDPQLDNVHVENVSDEDLLGILAEVVVTYLHVLLLLSFMLLCVQVPSWGVVYVAECGNRDEYVPLP